jgi:hypothetical protein
MVYGTGALTNRFGLHGFVHNLPMIIASPGAVAKVRMKRNPRISS